MPTWTAVDLANVRTEFLASIDRTRIPAPAARAITQELQARRTPLYTYDLRNRKLAATVAR